MFAYCNNNPVIYMDTTGNFIQLAIFVSLAEIVLTAVVIVVVCEVVFSNPTVQQGIRDTGSAVADAIGHIGELIIHPTEQTIPDTAEATIAQKNKPKGGTRPKSVNLPSFGKLVINYSHIMSGHFPGGNRNPFGKKDVFYGLSISQLERAIREAYNVAERIQTQGDRVLINGYSSTYDIVIQMWVNVKQLVVETAWPKG